MELKSQLLRAATARPGVLLAVRSGVTRERLFVEAELVRRGWPCAAGPAFANLLLCVGEPTAAEDDWAERLWLGIPAPKARVTASAVGRIRASLMRTMSAVAVAAAGLLVMANVVLATSAPWLA